MEPPGPGPSLGCGEAALIGSGREGGALRSLQVAVTRAGRGGLPRPLLLSLSREDHEGARQAAPDPTVGTVVSAAGAGQARGGRGRAHLPGVGRGGAGMAGVPPVPARHIRAPAVQPEPPHGVPPVPAAALHAVLELPGALPLLQRHLRRGRGGGAALLRRAQPRLPLPPRLLRALGLLPGARPLPAGLRRGGPRHPHPEHAVPAMPPGHLLRQQFQHRAVPAAPQLHGPGPGPQRAGLPLPRRHVHKLPRVPAQHARVGGAVGLEGRRDRGV